MTFKAALSLAVLAGASAASAHVVIYGADQTTTSSTLTGGDRELNRMGFIGASNSQTGADFLRWQDGKLSSSSGSFGWTDAIQRDLGGGNLFVANPDRADDASPYAGEAGGTGTLKEVFGPFGRTGYKNMSWIIDGEDDRGYVLDLYFAKGQFLVPDNDDKTVEISVLERNGNSDFTVVGIKADGTDGESAFISRVKTEPVGWNLDTLEIGFEQKVSAVGLSLGDEWTGIIGIRIKVADVDNGPDLIGIGSSAPVPAPGAAALVGLAGLTMLRRRR